MTNLKPLFKYCGSKTRIGDWLLDNISTNVSMTYCEPFFGGGSVFALLYNSNKIKSGLINDIDEELMLLYTTIKYQIENFINEVEIVHNYLVQGAKYSGRFKASGLPNKDAYNNIKEHYCFNYTKLSDVEKSARLYVMMKYCFNGMKKKYNKYNGYFSTPPGNFPKNFKPVDVELIRNWHLALQDFTITSLPIKDLDLKKYDTVYMDPPYRDCSIDYENSFNDSQLQALIDIVKTTSNSYLSNWLDDPIWWHSACEGLTIKVKEHTHTAGRGKAAAKVQEILVLK